MATLLQIRNRVLFEIGNKNGIDDIVDQAINDAIVEVVATWKPQETIQTATATTVAETASYSFSSSFSVTDVLAIFAVRNDTDDYRLKKGGLLEYTLTRHNSGYGNPNKWARQGDNLILYSLIPLDTSMTIELWYVQRPAELTADANTFPLNREWEKPVVKLAASYVWASLNNVEKAELKNAQYERIVSRRDHPEDIEDESPEVQLVPVSNVGIGGMD